MAHLNTSSADIMLSAPLPVNEVLSGFTSSPFNEVMLSPESNKATVVEVSKLKRKANDTSNDTTAQKLTKIKAEKLIIEYTKVQLDEIL